MSQRPTQRTPSFSITSRGWQWVTGVSMVVTLGLLVALLSQTALWNRSEHNGQKPDGLTTLALVLAIISFFVQIIVFVFQMKTASDDVARNEELAAETSAVLTKIEVTSKGTQEVLFSQFNRLLDYIVGPGGDRGVAIAEPPEIIDAEPTARASEAVAEGDAPVTRADLDRFARELNLRLAGQRPTFSTRDVSGDPELTAFLRSYPSRQEAEDAVTELMHLSPLALAFLSRIATREAESGRRVLLARPTDKLHGSPATELEARGLAIFDQPGETGYLTDKARAIARVLPTGKSATDLPEWWWEITAPFRTPLS